MSCRRIGPQVEKVVARAALQPNQAGHDTRPKTRPFKFTSASVDVLFALLNMLSNFLLSLDAKLAKLVYCCFFSINLLCPQEARQVPKYMLRQSELLRLQLAEINMHALVHWGTPKQNSADLDCGLRVMFVFTDQSPLPLLPLKQQMTILFPFFIPNCQHQHETPDGSARGTLASGNMGRRRSRSASSPKFTSKGN